MSSVLFVCLGNICRSPLAEAMLRKMAAQNGRAIVVDSAGVEDCHVGELPDPRARSLGFTLGYEMTMRARQVRPEDFEQFDVIIALEQAVQRELETWPGSQPEKIRLATSFDPNANQADVPDPWYGKTEDFQVVVRMLRPICEGILREV